MTSTINLEDVALDVQQEAMRLIGVASMHRAKLLREQSDPDVRLQRGNASSFSHTEGVVSGMARVLRSFGFVELADQIEYAHGEMCDEVVPADAARRVTNDEVAELEQAAGFEEWSR